MVTCSHVPAAAMLHPLLGIGSFWHVQHGGCRTTHVEHSVPVVVVVVVMVMPGGCLPADEHDTDTCLYLQVSMPYVYIDVYEADGHTLCGPETMEHRAGLTVDDVVRTLARRDPPGELRRPDGVLLDVRREVQPEERLKYVKGR
jgi:hypothetical protein